MSLVVSLVVRSKMSLVVNMQQEVAMETMKTVLVMKLVMNVKRRLPR